MVKDLPWYLLAELSLDEFLPGDDRNDETMFGTLAHALQPSGVPLESINTIAQTLSESRVKDAQGHIQSGGEWFRIFIHHKLRNEGCLRENVQLYPAARTVEQIQKLSISNQNMNGGWGFFLIETTARNPSDSSPLTWHSVDLYLYKEGE